MSLLTYISFPREVDTSCLISRIDKSKSFNVGKIRGTELEKQIKIDIGKLPDEFNIYVGDTSDWNGLALSGKGVETLTFNNVFANQYIYWLYSHCTPFRAYYNGDESDLSEDALKVIRNVKENVAVCRQQLYDTVQLNIKPDEIVEIYSEWANHKSIYGPPVEERIIDAEQIFSSESLNLLERVKIVIQRVK